MNNDSHSNNVKRTILLHSFVWLFFICCGIIQLFLSPFQFGSDFFAEWVTYMILFYLNYIYLIPLLLYRKKYASYVIILIGIVTVFTLVRIQYIIPNHQNVIMPPIVDATNKEFIPSQSMTASIESTPLFFTAGISFPYTLVIFISIVIHTLSEYYSNQKKQLIVESQRKTSELIYLRKQINPHFLFNSLNAIYSLANKKSDLVANAIVTLSELMRYMLYETDNKSVLLEKEINYIKNYIDLQKLRLNDIENIQINIHGDTQNKHIEPLLLISFIENAFKYGTDYKGATHVKIKIAITDNILDFWVENKIEKKQVCPENSGIGMTNIESRLQLLYPKAHKLIISEENGFYHLYLNLRLDQINVF